MPDKLCAEDLKTRLARVRGRINEAASKAGRSPDGVTLVAVSKFHPAKAVAEAALRAYVPILERRVLQHPCHYLRYLAFRELMAGEEPFFSP